MVGDHAANYYRQCVGYNGANVGTHSIPLPSGIVAGERLLMLIAATGSTTASAPHLGGLRLRARLRVHPAD